eukprot:3249360-Rhodomonas_salina.1
MAPPKLVHGSIFVPVLEYGLVPSVRSHAPRTPAGTRVNFFGEAHQKTSHLDVGRLRTLTS